MVSLLDLLFRDTMGDLGIPVRHEKCFSSLYSLVSMDAEEAYTFFLLVLEN